MGLKTTIQAILRKMLGISDLTLQNQIPVVPMEKIEPKATQTPSETGEFHSIWNFLDIKENTQAAHIVEVLGFDEWVEMEEIRRRILELFGIQYKNERSLYPHLKTLADLGLLETTDAGGRRKWRKKEILIKTQKKEQKRKETAKTTQKQTAQT